MGQIDFDFLEEEEESEFVEELSISLSSLYAIEREVSLFSSLLFSSLFSLLFSSLFSLLFSSLLSSILLSLLSPLISLFFYSLLFSYF